ncbi:phage minor head protein [Sphingomonas jeddahensis]|uniref:Phage Mu protein F like protein n=1 Tax=Sphingomonas jeddahensis TaxID=1915074 RepID=A0A1V2EU26_9SPHN|nr:phage minor head protein [Sphingomonas jeddahensis]ONF95985.1 Phage Mu protein F like protein [Sphingomonas jeddahensis]
MIDPIDQLTARQEAGLKEMIDAALDDAIALFDLLAVGALMANADEEGPDARDHYADQLTTFISTDDPEQGQLADALDATSGVAALATFFAAVVALAAAQARHIANTNAADAVTARDNAIRSFRAAYLHESANALRDTAQRMLAACESADSRAAQIRRVLGLSVAQARSLHVMREALIAHAADPKRDAKSILVATRGSITAAQRQMLAKAIRTGTSSDQAEKLLDRHAKALRHARTKAVAGNAAHQIAETAKLTGWQIAQCFGALPADQRRYWQTAGDERVRLSHAQVPGMNRDGVPLNQPFATPLGPCLTPPLEHGCRCKARLVRKP